MKSQIAKLLAKNLSLSESEILNLIETPPSQELGDYAFPCFSLARSLKKNPNQIAQELSVKIKSNQFEKTEAKGPYINFFVNRALLAEETINKILKEKDKFGFSKEGKGKTIV